MATSLSEETQCIAGMRKNLTNFKPSSRGAKDFWR